MKANMISKALFTAVASLAAVFCVVADEEAYTFVTKENGYSYIQINQDLEAFSFTSDFKSIGNSGKVGYVKYSQGLTDDQLAEYIKTHADDAEFGKKIDGGEVELGALNAGDRVGFYLQRNNGVTVYETAFVVRHGADYLEFDKNGGSGKDEAMSISNVKTKSAAPSGQPLPGLLAVLLVGGVGAGALKLRKRRA